MSQILTILHKGYLITNLKNIYFDQIQSIFYELSLFLQNFFQSITNQIFDNKIMSCHYSCATCSASIYLYYCITCPSSRQMIGSTCLCKQGFIETQQNQCIQSASAIDYAYETINSFLNVLYYANIGLFWLYVMFTFSRVNLPKIRLIILFSQLASLINYFPFYLNETGQKAIEALSAFNFNYMTQIYQCTETGLPTMCQLYENLVNPIILFPIFVSGYLASYVIINICYKNQLQSSINFLQFIKQSWFMLFFIYIDLTAVIWSISLSRILMATKWGYIFIGVYLLVIFVIVMVFYRYLNNKQQITHLYRIKNNWTYLYDQNYHLAYIDFIFQLHQNKQNQKQQAQLEGQIYQQQVKAFIPISNMIILELLFRIIMAASSVILFYFKPALFCAPMGFLFIIGILYFGASQSHQCWDILAYLMVIVCYQILVTTFWTPYYQGISSAISIIASICIILNFGVLFAVKIKMKDLEINYVYKEQQKVLIKDQGSQKTSQDQLMQQNDETKQQIIRKQSNDKKLMTFDRTDNIGLIPEKTLQESKRIVGDNISKIQPIKTKNIFDISNLQSQRLSNLSISKKHYNSNLKQIQESNLDDVLKSQL